MGYELYVISDPTLAGGLSHEEIARLAIEGGADAIQLRDKKCDKQDLVATGRRMRKVTRDANVLFVVNDCLDVALSCGADGVHLGQCDLQVHEARARAPRKFIIGASVSCAADAILAIQLRDKKCDKQHLVATGRHMRKVTRDANVLFVVNDWLDVALSCGADGVHLGQSDLQVHEARARAPRKFIIGASVSCAADAILAVQQGADYVAASPVFPTASKPDAGAACGIAGIRQIKRAVDVPVVAIGGIGLHNVQEVLEAGADGIAVISAVVAQPDITRAAREMKKRIVDSLSSR